MKEICCRFFALAGTPCFMKWVDEAAEAADSANRSCNERYEASDEIPLSSRLRT